MSEWKSKVSMPTQMGKACLAHKASIGVRGLALIGPEVAVLIPTKLYVGLNLSPTRVVKVDLPSFTREDALTLDTGENLNEGAMASHEDFLYIGTFSSPSEVIKINQETLTKVDVLSGEDSVLPMMVVDGFLYFVSRLPATPIGKVDLSTFTKVDTLSLSEGNTNEGAIATSGGYLYVGTAGGKITKVDLSDFTKVSVLTLDTSASVHGLSVKSPFLYGGFSTFPGKAFKVDLTTFTQVGASATLTIDSVQATAIHGNYLYAVGEDNCDVSKIALSTLSEDSVLAITGGLGSFSILVAGDYVYVPDYYATPSKIYKINLSTFTLEDTLTLAATENKASCMAAST